MITQETPSRHNVGSSQVDIFGGGQFFGWNLAMFSSCLYDVCEQVQQETLFELILAANYMDIKPLLDLTCATVASMIKVMMFFIGGTGKRIMDRNELRHGGFPCFSGEFLFATVCCRS